MLWVHRVLFVTAVLHSLYRGRNFEIDGTHWYTIADTTQVQEIKYLTSGVQRLTEEIY